MIADNAANILAWPNNVGTLRGVVLQRCERTQQTLVRVACLHRQVAGVRLVVVARLTFGIGLWLNLVHVHRRQKQHRQKCRKHSKCRNILTDSDSHIGRQR